VAMSKSPDNVLSQSDPGDDVQRRFRYQATKAAMLALSLLDDEAQVEEVYCEHHEDVLVKKCGARFHGVQIKTRFDEAGPHKSTDEEIVTSIKRFVALERRFGGTFDGYTIGSNAGFWDDDKTVSSLPYLLSLIAAQDSDQLHSKVQAFIKKLFPEPKQIRTRRKKVAAANNDGAPQAENSNSSEADQRKEWEENVQLAEAVLRKLRVETLPSLRDMRQALIAMLPRYPQVGDRLYSELDSIADNFIAEMLKAGSLAQEPVRDRYLTIFDNPDAIATSETIKGKRITKERLITLLQMVLSAEPSLRTDQPITLDNFPSGMSTLDLKMAAGGISIENISLAKDLKASTEYLLMKWLHKNGKAATDARYQHLRTLTRSECQEAYDRNQSDDRLFGPEMLNDVRGRLRARHTAHDVELFGSSYEHLMGMAGILTEDCTVWWSKPFPIPSARKGAV
jgi:Cap4 dsDNA endonuclease